MQSLVIIPTYNERDNLVPLVTALLAIDSAFHVLVVDDNSPDGTGRIAADLASTDPRVHVLHRPGKQGLGTAYSAGFRYALARGYDCVVQMDADFSHRPDDLLRLLRAAESADVVIGSRTVPGGRTVGWSLLRHLLSKGGTLYARLVLGLPIRDCTSGFKVFSHRFILNDRWTFRDVRPVRPWPSRLLGYHAICSGGLAISVIVLAALTSLVNLHYLIANIFSVGAATLWNYGANARLTWERRPTVRSTGTALWG